MLTQEQINYYSVLMAEFIDVKEGFPHKTDGYGYVQTLEGFEISDFINEKYHEQDKNFHQFAIEDLKYHISYDWLMPVWVKFRDLENEIVDYQFNKLAFYVLKAKIKDLLTEKDTPIEAFEELAKAIEWYNTIKN